MRRQLAAFSLSALAAVVPGLVSQSALAQDAQKVLASPSSGLNLPFVQAMLSSADAAAAAGQDDEAKLKYENTREAAGILAKDYRIIGGAFRGLDARIPREMDQKARDATELQADAELRLAALLRRMNKPELAARLYVTVVQRMTPTTRQGSKAYQGLLELGFVTTPFAGGSAAGN